MYHFRPFFLAFASVCLITAMGCWSSSIIPHVDPEAATDAAMELYDKNGDGVIDQEELAASPSLRAALAETDTNGDKNISRKELLIRVTNMYSREIGLVPVHCMVRLKKKPLGGANIRFIPEPFLGVGTTKEAFGVTARDGIAEISIPTDQLPEDVKKYKMVQPGYYRVEITHPNGKLPDRYNTNTELGFEVHPDSHAGNKETFDLEKK